MKELSAKQRRILEYIRDFIDEHDYPPSIRQIQEACGISSTSGADYNLRILEKQGYIRRDREVSRAIELLEPGGRRPRVVPVPIIGTIAAGQPIPVPTAAPWPGNDGDIVIMEAASSARDGDMVAAWLKREQEATLKRFYREGSQVRLQPANETMQPIRTDADNVEVQGRVIGAVRALS